MITSIELNNICKIKYTRIDIHEPLNIFFGKIKAGKSTILKSIPLALGGSIPDDLLTHGENEGFIKINLFPLGYIKRSFYRKTDGKTYARPKIEYINTNGEIENQPATALKKFLNPFIADSYFFEKLSDLNKEKFIIDFFGVDLSSFNKEKAALKEKAKNLRTKISMYGDIDTISVEKPDIKPLEEKRNALIEAHTKKKEKIEIENKKIDKINNTRFLAHNRLKEIGNEYTELEKEIEKLTQKLKSLEAEEKRIDFYLLENPQGREYDIPPEPEELKNIQEKITDIKIQEILYKQYLERVETQKKKDADIQELKSITEEEKVNNQNKIKHLANLSEKSNIKDLIFNQDGHAIFEGTAINLLSGSQTKLLSSKLAGLYPEGLGIQLIDGGESLGDSIYDYIHEANNNKTTILMSCVSDAPAETPNNIGVWVVEDGRVKKQ